jgi:hypothetical protein
MKSHIANLLAALALFAGPLLAEDAPDPHAILKTVRIAQSEQNRTLNGEIRNGGKSLPFRLVCAGSVIRYEFTNPPQVLQVKLGEKDARLEEVVDGKAAKVSLRRFDERVRDTDISFEDLSLCFLYWPNATVQGDQTMLLQKCWIVRVQPGSRGDTQYSKVDLWISKKTGALMQAEAFDAAGKLARRFKVMSGQSLGGGLWILKEMRIESFSGTPKDRNPTYLDIDKPESGAR